MSTPRPIVAHPHVELRDGTPYVVGTQVPVRRLWSWHQRGVLVATLIRRYPTLGPSRILDALSFAYDNRELIDDDIAREAALLRGRTGT